MPLYQIKNNLKCLHMLIILISLSIPSITFAADRFADVEIKTIKVRNEIYMLMGAGGNIGLLNGEDGLLMIDDQFSPLAGRIKAAIQKINNSAPTYLLNTHHHGDHTGGNEHFGDQSIIMAHENVRLRLVSESAGKLALPVITYQKEAHIYFNNEEIQLTHMPHGHTDGDTIINFNKSNVIHMGDHFFNGSFPYVDLGAGGSVTGLINSISAILATTDNDTKIIPGHGPLANRKDLENYLTMLLETSTTVTKGIRAGQNLNALQAQGLGQKWHSWGKGFINEQRWIQTLFTDLSK